MAGAIVTADFAVRAIRIAAALRIGALAHFVADRATVAVVIGAALGAIGAFRAVATAVLTVWAVRHDGTQVSDTVDTRAESCRYRDTVACVAALATRHPGAVAADTVIQIGAQAAFTFLAGGAGANAGAAVADVASITVVIGAALRANAARAAVELAGAGIGAEKLLRTDALLAGCLLAFVVQRTVIEHSFWRTGCALRAGKVEARAGDCDANRSPEEPLDRRAPRCSHRKRPSQGIELLFIHEPVTPFPAPGESSNKNFLHRK